MLRVTLVSIKTITF